jgi:YD repeat-containing protein
MLGIFDPINNEAPPAQAYSKLYDCDPATGNVLYEGFSASSRNPQAADAVWAIRKYTYDGAGYIASTRWSNGTTAENCVWDNRATVTYK